MGPVRHMTRKEIIPLTRSHVALVLTVLCALVFGQALLFGFVNLDDYGHVLHNAFVNAPSWRNVARLWSAQYFGLYIPVMYSVWAGLAVVSAWLTGDTGAAALQPGLYHALNLFLHLANTLMVFALVLRLVRIRSPEARSSVIAAGLGAALFALHPIQVEPVAWISGAKDVLSATFALAALHLYLRAYPQKGARVQPPRARTRGLYLGALACFVAGWLTKPGVLVLPLLIFCVNRFVLGRSTAQSRWGLGPMLALMLPVAIAVKVIQTDADMEFVPALWSRPLIALDALGFYLVKMVAPWNLAVDYGRTPKLVLDGAVAPLAWIPVVVALGVWWQRKARPWLLGAAVWLVICLAPVSGLLPFFYQDFSTVADRYLYLAMVGAAMAVAIAVQGSRRLQGITLAVCMAYVGLAWHQTGAWKNEEVLFTRTLTVNPRSYLAEYNLAQHFLSAGDLTRGRQHLDRSLQIQPHYLQAQSSYGTLLLVEGKLDAGRVYLTQLAADQHISADKHIEAHGDIMYKLGYAQERLGRRDDALASYLMATQIDWTHAEAQFRAALLLMNQGQFAMAHSHLAIATRLDPSRLDFRKFEAEARHRAQTAALGRPLTK